MINKAMALVTLLIFYIPICASENTETAKICHKVKNIPFPTADQINPKNLSLNPKCDAFDYYYGIHCEINYEKARLRGYEELKKSDNNDGSIVLMMLYANGEGVKKNIPLAEKLACENFHALAELEGRILHLAKLNNSSKKTTKFDFCDDITSGYMMGYCSNISEKIATVKHNAALKVMIHKWSSQEKYTFKQLQKALDKFAELRSENEVDQSGSARSMFVIQEEAIQKEDFIESIKKLENNQAPKYSKAQLDAEDIKLNSLYYSLQNPIALDSLTTITPEGIKKTQMAWMQYRDAWIAFAKVRYPQYPSGSIAAWFTKKRNHMLHSLKRRLQN